MNNLTSACFVSAHAQKGQTREGAHDLLFLGQGRTRARSDNTKNKAGGRLSASM